MLPPDDLHSPVNSLEKNFNPETEKNQFNSKNLFLEGGEDLSTKYTPLPPSQVPTNLTWDMFYLKSSLFGSNLVFPKEKRVMPDSQRYPSTICVFVKYRDVCM